jgi:GGDEF domain-containing protein
MRSSNTSSDKGAVGHRVRRQADRQPQTGRLGGEELAIFIPNMTAKELEGFLKEKSGSNDVAKIQAPLGFKFSELPVLPGKDRPDRPDGYVSFSGGIIDLKPNMPLSEALTRIDTTLYKAKEDGRDRVLIAE